MGDMEKIKETCNRLHLLILDIGKQYPVETTRSKVNAITHLDECFMWCDRAIQEEGFALRAKIRGTNAD